ncbi:type I glutamate--ammonia ligase [Roseovarius aquimarinus]|uniref:GS catalytic domain-containing protein n=1 Tax=Roseovarius aquimarinus TaxID=1229156 RepID=A0ABW7I6Z2_9RHOB
MPKLDADATGMIGNVDLSNVMRGRSFPIARLDAMLAGGLPWVPANITLSPCNSLPAKSPFGPVGETRLMAVDAPPIVFPAQEGLPTLQFHLAEITHHDGTPWPVCPRSALRAALTALKEEFGLDMKAGFEHELYIEGLEGAPSPAFSLEGTRRVSDIAARVNGILAPAGAALEQCVAEFGHYQFEIAGAVTDALSAADNAVLALAAIRDQARRAGLHATFAPKPDPQQPGSGVHVHFSLWEAGAPVTAAGDALTPRAASFAAGIFAALPSVLACSISNANSYARLAPSSWVGVFPCIGTRNREAAIRICPRAQGAGGVNAQASMEYRLADATANPYLMLAALIHAGMDGMRAALPSPPDVTVDPATLSDTERRDLGLDALPSSPAQTLSRADALERWFGQTFTAAFRAVRENDIEDAARLGEDYTRVMTRAI